MAIETAEPYGDARLRRSFWRKVVMSDSGCWEWTGYLSKDGYGRYGSPAAGSGISSVPHRLAYQVLVGEIPAGWEVDHLCHVPEECSLGDKCVHRRCVNPAHLRAVPSRVNCLRAGGLAAQNFKKTHCPQGHPLSGENLRLEGRKRRCITCRRDQTRGYRAAAA